MRKRTSYYILLLGIIISLASCGIKPGDITIECVPLLGETVNVSGLKAELHLSASFNGALSVSETSGSSDMSSCKFVSVEAGTYYCQVWGDNNANNQIDVGDFYGFHTEGIVIIDGEQPMITVEVYQVK